MGEWKQELTRRQFLRTTAAGVVLGLSASPNFLEAGDEYDLVVVSRRSRPGHEEGP